MPRQIQSIPVTFASTGIVLKSSSDEIPLTAYKALVNVRTDKENTLSVRKGFERLNDGLPGTPYSGFLLVDIEGRQWRYAVVNQRLYVAPVVDPADATIWPLPLGNKFAAVPGGGGLSGTLSADQDPRPIWTSYTLLGLEMKPFVFLADGKEFLKHPGGMGNATRVGIPKPNPFVSIALETNTTTTIEDFEDYTLWTADNSTVTQVNPGKVGKGLSIKITGDAAVGGAYKAITSGGYPVILDLGSNDADEVIELWVQFKDNESALNCKEIVVAFGLSLTGGDTTFSTRLEKAVTPSSFEAASQPGSTGRTLAYGGAVPTANDNLAYRNVVNFKTEYGTNDPDFADRLSSVNPADTFNQAQTFNTGQPAQMRPGAAIWNRIRIKKGDFTRVGESALTAPDLNWSTITAIRIDLSNIATASGSKNQDIYFDDFTWLNTGKLFGIDYKWVYTYYNSLTNTESDYSDIIDVPYPGAEYSQYRLTFPPCPPVTPPLADPDKIRIYRLGGTVAEFKLIDTVPYTAGAVPAAYVDNIADGDQTSVLQTDNQLPPNKVKGCYLWDDRLWTWGGEVVTEDGTIVAEPPNRLRFSKGVTVESFPAAQYVYVGSGSEAIQNLLEHDGELFIFTLTKVYRIVGNAGVYRAVGTAVNQGLRSPHGVCKGVRSVYMYSYDGIYEFPSGRKISEPVNEIFFNETANEIPPVAVGREQEVAMAFYDSKMYFSYCTTTDPDITADVILVWDSIYERWHWYMYGAQDMRLEPENNILVGWNLFQWDHILDGVPSGIIETGPWPMAMETGFADHCIDAFHGIFWAVDTKDYDLGMPDQEKRFFDFVIDADTQGEPIVLQAAFDLKTDTQQALAPYDTIGMIQTTGRQRVILPAPIGDDSGDSVLAVRCALRIYAGTSPTATSTTRLFKIVHRILPEPIRHRTFVTDWSDYGTPGPKYFRELWVEMDTFGKALRSIEVQVDQAVAQVLTPIAPVTGQTKVYYGLLPDIRGTLARLKFITDGEFEVKVWDHNFQVMPEPPLINTIQTPWSDEGYPYSKLWKEVLLDIDTAGNPITFNFWVDNKIVDTWTVNTLTGRERITHSLPRDILGKLGRVTVSETSLDPVCCLPQGVRWYGVQYIIDKEPADVTLSDSYDYLWSFDRLKVVRRFWVAMKNPDCDVTMDIYVDEVLVSTKTIPMEQRSTGFSKRRIDMESAIKGRLFRIVFTGVFAFQLYWERSEWELKDLNTEDGYRRERMVPPQTF